MANNKESEIVATSRQIKEQKKKIEKPGHHIADTANQFMTSHDLNLRIDSKLCINSPTPEESSKREINETSKAVVGTHEAKENLDITENKSSTENKSFKIIKPDDNVIEETAVKKRLNMKLIKKEIKKYPMKLH